MGKKRPAPYLADDVSLEAVPVSTVESYAPPRLGRPKKGSVFALGQGANQPTSAASTTNTPPNKALRREPAPAAEDGGNKYKGRRRTPQHRPPVINHNGLLHPLERKPHYLSPIPATIYEEDEDLTHQTAGTPLTPVFNSISDCSSGSPTAGRRIMPPVTRSRSPTHAHPSSSGANATVPAASHSSTARTASPSTSNLSSAKSNDDDNNGSSSTSRRFNPVDHWSRRHGSIPAASATTTSVAPQPFSPSPSTSNRADADAAVAVSGLTINERFDRQLKALYDNRRRGSAATITTTTTATSSPSSYNLPAIPSAAVWLGDTHKVHFCTLKPGMKMSWWRDGIIQVDMGKDDEDQEEIYKGVVEGMGEEEEREKKRRIDGRWAFGHAATGLVVNGRVRVRLEIDEGVYEDDNNEGQDKKKELRLKTRIKELGTVGAGWTFSVGVDVVGLEIENEEKGMEMEMDPIGGDTGDDNEEAVLHFSCVVVDDEEE